MLKASRDRHFRHDPTLAGGRHRRHLATELITFVRFAVADAVEKVGSEGVVSVEEAKRTDTAVEVVEGMQFDRGSLSPYFVSDAEKMKAEL